MTTSYERLREECNRRLPDRNRRRCRECGLPYRSGVECYSGNNCYGDDDFPETIDIADVLRVLYTREDFITLTRGKLCLGNWKSPDGRWTEEGTQEPICFDLSLSLSAPENEAACEAVLKLLDSEKDRVFVCREGDDYANCL